MNRDTIVFSACSFLLGLVIGSLLIGPRVVQSHLSGAPAIVPAPAAEGGGLTVAAPPNAMEAVREQLAALKQTVERDPLNFDALAQLGAMYMDAAKYPQAIEYYERALGVREEPNVRTDLGICYRQSGQREQALASFRRARGESPDHWQAMFNEAIVLADMRRFDEARALTAKLKQMRPTDAEVQRLDQALATAR
jgi:tetratricopeptide (TPR) repeat protein